MAARQAGELGPDVITPRLEEGGRRGEEEGGDRGGDAKKRDARLEVVYSHTCKPVWLQNGEMQLAETLSARYSNGLEVCACVYVCEFKNTLRRERR